MKQDRGTCRHEDYYEYSESYTGSGYHGYVCRDCGANFSSPPKPDEPDPHPGIVVESPESWPQDAIGAVAYLESIVSSSYKIDHCLRVIREALEDKNENGT
jgi:hypothetical protein